MSLNLEESDKKSLLQGVAIAGLGLSIGLILFIFGNTKFDGALGAIDLLKRMAVNEAIPDARLLMLVIVVASISASLSAIPRIGECIRHLIALPFVKFAFELCCFAIGVLVPAVASLLTQDNYGVAFGFGLLWAFILLIFTILFGTAVVLLGDSVTEKRNKSEKFLMRFSVPIGAFLMLVALLIVHITDERDSQKASVTNCDS